MQQASGMQITFILVLKFQKENLLANYDCFQATYASSLNPW